MNTVKQTLQTLIDELPEDCTLEEVQYRLYVNRGIVRSEQEGSITWDDMEKRYESCFVE